MTNLLFNSGNLTFENAIYQILGFQVVGTDGLHLFIENENNSIIIFLQFEMTTVNEISFLTMEEMLAALGNPTEIPIETL
jgi:hypothetical protein